MAAFKKTKDSALDFGKAIEESAGKSAEALGFVRKGALGLIGAFAGAEIAGFVGHMVTMDATTGRMAASIGTSVQNLSLWQEMVKRVGGDASSATSALSAMQDELNQIKYGNKMPEGGLTSLSNQAGIDLRTDNADTVYRKAQAFLSAQIASGKLSTSEARTFAGYLPGMNQDIFNLMIDNFKKLEAEARAMGGATGQSAAEARELQKETAALTNAFENLARETFPALTAVANIFTKAIKQDIADVKWFMGLFGMGGAKASTTSSGSPEMDDARKRLADGLSRQVFGGGGSSYRDAIAAVESAGSGGYAAVGPATAGGDRAYGRYQIMGNNIGPWSQEALGRRVTPQEFMANKDLQDQIFDFKFGQYVTKYGPQGASRAWLAGEGGMNDPSRHDAYGTNVLEYERRFNSALGARGSAGSRGAPAASSTSSSEVNIGTMNVNAPKADDADGIAADIGGALKRQSILSPANTGMQ